MIHGFNKSPGHLKRTVVLYEYCLTRNVNIEGYSGDLRLSQNK